LCDPSSKHACVKTDASTVDTTGVQKSSSHTIALTWIFKKTHKGPYI